MSAFSLTRGILHCVGSSPRLSPKSINLNLFADPMKLLSYSLAFASLASLACGCAFLLFSLPIPALLCFCGFALLGLAAAKINPEI
jgi:hypothetical protein